MMLTRTQLRALILEELTRSSLIREGEDESADDTADELFGSDEGGDDAADESSDESADEESTDEGGDEGGEDSSDEEGGEEEKDAADEDKDEETDKKDEKSEEVLGPVGDEVDTALKDVMADFEKRALDSAAAKAKLEPAVGPKKEGRMSLARLLFEADDDEVLIDVGTFASDVARLINNYDSLIDMEAVIYTKAMDFLEKKYGKDYAEQLRDTLARDYNIDIDVKQDPEKAERPIYAIGASSAGGGA